MADEREQSKSAIKQTMENEVYSFLQTRTANLVQAVVHGWTAVEAKQMVDEVIKELTNEYEFFKTVERENKL